MSDQGSLEDLSPYEQLYVKVLSEALGSDQKRWAFHHALTGEEAAARRWRDWPPDPRIVPWFLHYATRREIVGFNEEERGFSLIEKEPLARSAVAIQYEVLEGLMPVIQLSPAQQVALWHTEPDIEDLKRPHAERPLPYGAVVLCADPIRVEEGFASLAGVIIYYAGDTLLICYLMLGSDGRAMGVSFGRIDIDIEPFLETAPPLLAHGMRFSLAVAQVVPMFGLTDREPDSVRVPRAVRRRRERDDAKTPAPTGVAVRYIKDRGSISMKHESTGGHIRPHLRIGHVRQVRTGSMTLPKDERPTVRRFIQPCIVNGHLGDPDEIVVYKDRTRRI